MGSRNFMDTFGWCAGPTGPSTKLNKKRDANLFPSLIMMKDDHYLHIL